MLLSFFVFFSAAPLCFVLPFFPALVALCLGSLWSPPPRPLFFLFFCAPLVSAFPLFPALTAFNLGALWLPAPPFFVPLLFFSFAPAFCWVPPLAALGLGTIWLGFCFLPRLRPFVWCVRSALVRCPPPPPAAAPRVLRRPASCSVVLRTGVGCVVWFLVFLCAVLCWYAGALPCWFAGALLFGVLSCCVVGFVAGRLPWALAAPFLLVSCSALLCRAVLCGVLSCVVPSCHVMFSLVLPGRLVRRVVLHCLGCVWLPCSALPPPLLLPLLLGLLLLTGPLTSPVVVLCLRVRCCVVLLCCLSCVLLLAGFTL